jgi:hypothetical protein
MTEIELKMFRKRKLKEERKKYASLNHLRYIQALSYKLAGRYEEAQELYHEYSKVFVGKERAELAISVFGLLVLPSLENRRKIMNVIEDI